MRFTIWRTRWCGSRNSRFRRKTNEVTREYLQDLAKAAPPETAALMNAAAQDSQDAIAKLSAASTALNAMLHTTCVATMLDGGHAINALPQTAGANVNCRVLPEVPKEEILATLKQVVTDDQVKITPLGEVSSGPPSAIRPDLFKAAGRITDTMWPGVPVFPLMVMGATDGLYLRAAGIPTYGVMGFFIERDDFRAHGRDERLGVKEFYEAEAFLYELVKSLST